MSNGLRALHDTLPIEDYSKNCRVLHVFPGPRVDHFYGQSQLFVEKADIYGELRVVSLDNFEERSYGVLSYVREDENDYRRINIEGHEVSMNEGLYGAINAIRTLARISVIWVDTICVNENNPDEMSCQKDLYRELCMRSSKIYIWLGGSVAQSQIEYDPFKIIDHLANDKHIFELPGYHEDLETGRYTFTENDEFFSLWDSFSAMANSSWWTQPRSISDMSSLSDDCKIIFGRWTTTWQCLELAYMLRNEHIHPLEGCCVEAWKVFPKHHKVFLNLFLSRKLFL
jgi:Heterokaryon incompatibility protein (HET)